MTAVGSILGGKYRIVSKLGEGGMGLVFHAENIVTGKHVALKLMHAHVATNPHYVERFVREARAAAKLDHPNVLDIYDIAQEGQVPYLIMELLRGETLREYLKRNPYLEVPAFIALMLPAMDGVATAHDAGVVHRDLKPDNILLAKSTAGAGFVPKVVDFGIARLVKHDERPLTQAGAMMGTPDYMSLEQLRGADQVDARTDIYAFGVMLYDGIAGRLPFQATTLADLILKLARSQPPSISELRPDLPHELTTIIDRAIARERDDRWPDLRVMAEALAPFAHDTPFRKGKEPLPRLGRGYSGVPERAVVRQPVKVPETQREPSSSEPASPERRNGRESQNEPVPSDSLRPHEVAPASKTAARYSRDAIMWVMFLAVVGFNIYRLVSSQFSSNEQSSAGTPEKISTYEAAKQQVEARMRDLAAFTHSTIHSPVCLVDANGDAILDVVGTTALANRGSAVILDGRNGKELWRGGSYALGATLFCANQTKFVLNDVDSFLVTIRDARTPEVARELRLSDVPDRWGFGDDCVSIRTKDDGRYGLSLTAGKPDRCDAPVDVFYNLPESAMLATHESRHLRRGDDHYVVELRKPGTPVLTVRAYGPNGWTTQLEYQNSSAVVVLAADVIAVVGRPIEEPEGRLTMIGLDVATGRILYQQPLCGRGLAIQSLYANGPNVVLMEPWTGVWTFDAKSGRVVWRSGSC